MKTLVAAALALLFFATACPVPAQEQSALVQKRTVPLPGVKGRFDHFAIDATNHRLFIAALGNNSLEVIDVNAGQHLQSIPGMSKPTGVLYLADLNQVLVANGSDGTLKFLNGTTFNLERNLTGFDDADNLRLDPRSKLAWLGFGDGAFAVVDVASGKTSGTTKLSRHPESFQLEQDGARLFVNIPDARQVAVVDREKRSVVVTWPMQKFHANFPMALDEPGHRVFVGCRSPARLVVLDSATGSSIAEVPISGDTDDLFFDAARKRIYLSCGEGFIDVVAQRGADHYELKEKIPTRSGARTSYYSAALNQFYVGVPARGNQPAELRIFQVGN